MNYFLQSFSNKGNDVLELFFIDGISGFVDFSKYPIKNCVFHKFIDINFLNHMFFEAESRTITQPENIDIAPKTLYYKARNQNPPIFVKNTGIP